MISPVNVTSVRITSGRWMVFFLLILCIEQSFGQDYSDGRPQFRFQKLEADFNNSKFTSIIQDQYGYMWFGSLIGLHKYDGVNVSLYLTSKDSTTIPANRVESIYEDTNGDIWVGTIDGVCRYDRELDNFKRYQLEDVNPDIYDQYPNRVQEFTEDVNGTLWMVSEKEGLQFYDPESDRFRAAYHKGIDRLTSLHATCITADEEYLWVGTIDAGVNKINLKTGIVEKYLHDPADRNTIAGNQIQTFMIDNKRRLWISIDMQGIDRIDLNGDQREIKHYYVDNKDPYAVKSIVTFMISQDSRGRIWICNENGGLGLYDEPNDRFFQYLPNQKDNFSISSISVWSIFEDNQNRLWIGTGLDGINVINNYQHTFIHYFHNPYNSQGLSDNIIRDIFEDRNGNLWLATDGGGLNFFNRKSNSFRHIRHDPYDPESLGADAILTICEAADDKLWTGSWLGGVSMIDQESFKNKRFDDHQRLLKIFQIKKDEEDNLWFGGHQSGVSRLDWETKELETFMSDAQDPNSPADDNVSKILIRSDGSIWIGGEDNGLTMLRYQEGKKQDFVRYLHNPNNSSTVSGKLINDIFEDKDGKLWIATDGGISLFDDTSKSFLNFDESDGLLVNHVKSIIQDDNGTLWFATANGISKFDSVSNSFRNFTSNDGLPKAEFSRNSVQKTWKGELIFGSTKGFVIFHPDSLKTKPYKAPIYLTDFKVFNESLKIGREEGNIPQHISTMSEIKLDYNQSVFTIDFVALNYTYSNKNHYAHRLVNFEDEWIDVGNSRSATYTNLDPGTYRFEVKSANIDGVLNEEVATLTIVIEPPFYMTWWFRISLGLLLIIFVVGVVKYRMRNLQKMNTMLEVKVNKRTAQLQELIDKLKLNQDELGATNEELTAAMEELVEQKKRVEQMNDELQKTHNEVIRMNDLLDKRVNERTSNLVKANQELDRFVYSASHDLSAPLKSIMGLINVTKMETDFSNLNDYLSRMENSVVKLEEVISSLTQFSRNKGRDVMVTSCSFHEIVEEVLGELKHMMQESKIKIERHYDAREIIVTDFLRLKIVMTNLISNAIKYRDPYKENSVIQISLHSDNHTNVVQVKDNGIGIRKEYKNKIYKMFFRGTTMSQGSGLGLYIVKETVSKLKGSIKLKSIYGEFSEFTVSLPVQ